MARKKPRPQFDLFDDLELTQNIAFQQYDKDHPEVYQLFKEVTFEAIKKGFKYFSARGLFQVMRFNRGGKIKDDGFKLNNNYTPYYVRKFKKEFPQYDAFFECRRTKYTITS
ncbi:hypothetical protein [Gelidibacter japonicus]|uniref:hypothetical protein n=1 Tax=Gelidibacter japonicus TaxID=1962232 RepID=UPI002AFFA4C8|nr:hypothetical protein [Gelidibacter japonicus]